MTAPAVVYGMLAGIGVLIVLSQVHVMFDTAPQPSGLQNLLEFLWDYIRDLAREQIGEKAYRDWLPFIGTLFLFTLMGMLLRLLSPGAPLRFHSLDASSSRRPVLQVQSARKC